MSQITRCPQCQTRFKVVDDQLRISDGWVRCGKCKSVFDALAHLASRSPASAAKATPGSTLPPGQHCAPSAVPHSAAAPVQQPVVNPVPAASPQAPVPIAANEGAGPTMSAPASHASPQAKPANALVSPSSTAETSAVLVTENSLAVDPHANVPELSVLVFPRRAGFGDSGYVDSSWMSAYEDQAVDEQALSKPGAPPAQASVPAPGGLPAHVPENHAKSSAGSLESEWSEATGQLPDAVRNSSAGFSAHDDLAELKAREARLLDTTAEKKPKTDPYVAAQAADSRASAVAPAPANQTEIDAALLQPAKEPDKRVDTLHNGDSRAIQASMPAPLPAVPAHVAEMSKLEPASKAANRHAAAVDGPDPVVEHVQEMPGFVRQARRQAFWSQPGVRVASVLCALVLLVLLALQVGVTQRDNLAVQYPALRPALEKICHLARCEIALPRHLQSVFIDSTGFSPIGPGQFNLTVVLRNTASYAVAMPALELSLNDSAEKLLMRRVLSPSDLQAPDAIAPHGEWTGSVAVELAEGAMNVVGYRVLAFYP